MTRGILLLPVLTTLVLHAGDMPGDRATLKGSKGVAVIVDTLPADLPKEGVTEGELRTRLTQRLREAGIPLDDNSKDFVGIRVASVRDTRGPYAVAIRIGFFQPVTLVRDAAVRAAPETWDVDTVLMAPPKMLYRAAMDSIDDLAARFIAAWRSVNPQQ
jgi:hypothetical protein